MKKLLLLSTALMLGLTLSAQTQQGYVKTKGRMVNGKLVPGQGLKGATVSIKGRTAVLVKADDGAFSFPVPEAQFRVDSVRKKGYQLVDMETCLRSYKYSANPLYIVMETPEQQLQDQLAAERKIRRTLTNQLHQREDEIEALKEQQKISDEEYRQALQKLYEETDQNEQLVKDMVERYSKIDYDQLSEFDQQISDYILNGELTKADSLLSTKGNINERISQYRRHEAVNAKEKEELSQRQEQLEQSEVLAMQERNDLANDCYRKFEIFKIQHIYDSAAYYIEIRASLDTTNIRWNSEAGIFLGDYLAEYDKAISYLQKFYNKEPHDEIRKLINQKSYDKALDLMRVGITIGQISSMESLTIIQSYNDIGLEFFKQKKYESAFSYYNKALIALSEMPNQEKENHPYIALLFVNIGNYYIVQNDYIKSMDYYGKALNILERLGDDKEPKNSDAIIIRKKISEIETKSNMSYNTVIQPIQLQMHQWQLRENKKERLKKELRDYEKAINNNERNIIPSFSL